MNGEKYRHIEGEENSELLEMGKSLITAARLGDTAAVMELMKFGAPFATDWWGMTSLHHAAVGGHLNTCELLVRSGILKDARSKVEKTPLHLACQEGHSDVVMFLVANGADVSAADLIFMTPLHWAVQMKHYETVNILLQNGANPLLPNKFEKSCIDIALDEGCDDILSLLQEGPKEGPLTVVWKTGSRVVDIVKKRVFPAVSQTKTIKRFARKTLSSPPSPHAQSSIFKTIPLSPPSPESQSTTTNKEQEEMRLLLEEHGIEMLDGEDVNLVASAVDSGRTVILTEAGRQALSLTETKKPRSSGIAVKRTVPPTATSIKRAQVDALATVSQKYMQAKREADQLRILYAKKKREADEYQSKLQYIAFKSLSTVNNGSGVKMQPLGQHQIILKADDDELEDEDETSQSA